MATEKRLIGCGKGFKHGHFYKPWYRTYKAMMERCYLPTNGNYQRYGGKGVTVCEEWHDINKFAEWVEVSGYVPGLTIDRIDSSKGYSPDNCRWATKKQQSNNRKNTVFYTYKGETKPLTEWADMFGINRCTLYDRVTKRGWSVKRHLKHQSVQTCEVMGMDDNINLEAVTAEQQINEKIKAFNPQIVVSDHPDKPYYNISYYDIAKKEWYIGYGSYDIKNVYKWLFECFEEADCDMVEVIRCKDCRFILDRVDGTHGCYRHFMDDCNPYDYCSYGERKDNDNRTEL